MAQKNNTKFDKEQTAALASAVTALVNNINGFVEQEITPVINSLNSDDIIGESDTKEHYVAAVSEIEKTIPVITDKLGRMQKAIDAVCEATGVAINKNIQSTEDATATIAAAKKKVEESTGKNA